MFMFFFMGKEFLFSQEIEKGKVKKGEWLQEKSIRIINKSKPFIKRNKDYSIKFEIRSGYTILAVVVFYRFAGDTEWKMTKMQKTPDNEYKLNVHIAEREIEYCIFAVDKSLYSLGKLGNPDLPIRPEFKKKIISFNTVAKVLLFGGMMGLMVLNYKL